LSLLVLLGEPVGSRVGRSGSNKPSCRQAILSPSWSSRHCNHTGMRWSQVQPLAVVAEVAVAAVVAGASQPLVVVAGAPEWWDTRCGDASSTIPSCPSPTMTVHRQHSWGPVLAWLVPELEAEAVLPVPGVVSRARGA